MNDFTIKHEEKIDKYQSFVDKNHVGRGYIARVEEDPEKPYIHAKNILFVKFSNFDELYKLIESIKRDIAWVKEDK